MSSILTLTYIRKQMARLGKRIMKSYHVEIPKYDMPIRLRPWFLVFTCIIMAILAFLGFTNFSRALPLNDKLLHFVCFCLATSVFYFIVDVEERARMIWFWRHSGLIFTTFTCIFCGGILSEFVQAALPYKEFQWGDVLANLCGSSLGLYFSYHLERYHRKRREIARLYQPLAESYSDLEEDDEYETDPTQLLPIHSTHDSRPSHKGSRLTDVWDEREELFESGEFDDEDTNAIRPDGNAASTRPQIVVSHHS